MKHLLFLNFFILLLFGILIFTEAIAQQGITKYGERMVTNLDFVDKNGKISSNVSLNSNGRILIVADYEGNVYKTAIIGNQTWMAENLKSTKYSDGTSITGVYLYNTAFYVETYGRLYNWDAAMKNSTTEKTQGVCPVGWHLPSYAEWADLSLFLGGDNVSGGKLKETGSLHWASTNFATNESGFNALPGGYYANSTGYTRITEWADFWTSTQFNANNSRFAGLIYNSTSLGLLGNIDKTNAYSVRCIKN